METPEWGRCGPGGDVVQAELHVCGIRNDGTDARMTAFLGLSAPRSVGGKPLPSSPFRWAAGSRFPEGGAGPTKPSWVGPCSSAKGYPIGGVRACPAEVLGARSRQGRSCPMPANVPMVIRFKSVGLPKTGRGSRWRIGEEDGMPPWPARQCLPDDSPRVTRRHHRK